MRKFGWNQGGRSEKGGSQRGVGVTEGGRVKKEGGLENERSQKGGGGKEGGSQGGGGSQRVILTDSIGQSDDIKYLGVRYEYVLYPYPTARILSF